jgi:hypothetical protein
MNNIIKRLKLFWYILDNDEKYNEMKSLITCIKFMPLILILLITLYFSFKWSIYLFFSEVFILAISTIFYFIPINDIIYGIKESFRGLGIFLSIAVIVFLIFILVGYISMSLLIYMDMTHYIKIDKNGTLGYDVLHRQCHNTALNGVSFNIFYCGFFGVLPSLVLFLIGILTYAFGICIHHLFKDAKEIIDMTSIKINS